MQMLTHVNKVPARVSPRTPQNFLHMDLLMVVKFWNHAKTLEEPAEQER